MVKSNNGWICKLNTENFPFCVSEDVINDNNLKTNSTISDKIIGQNDDIYSLIIYIFLETYIRELIIDLFKAYRISNSKKIPHIRFFISSLIYLFTPHESITKLDNNFLNYSFLLLMINIIKCNKQNLNSFSDALTIGLFNNDNLILFYTVSYLILYFTVKLERFMFKCILINNLLPCLKKEITLTI